MKYTIKLLSASLALGGLCWLASATLTHAQPAGEKAGEQAAESADKAPTLTRETIARSQVAMHGVRVAIESHRVEMHSYAMAMTNDALVAEDLVQAAIARYFSRTADWHYDTPVVRSWLLREMTNMFLEGSSGSHIAAAASSDKETEKKKPGSKTRRKDDADEAAKITLKERARLSLLPRADACPLALVDLYGMSSADVAVWVGQSEENLKKSLDDSRKRMHELKDPQPASATARITDASGALKKVFEICKTQDLEAFNKLFGPRAEYEVISALCGYGNRAPSEVMKYTFGDPELKGFDLISYRGQKLIVFLYSGGTDKDGQPALRIGDMIRVYGDSDDVTRLRMYYFCPETMMEIAKELGVDWRNNGYRHG